MWLSCSKFPGLLNIGQKFLCMCSRTWENEKKTKWELTYGTPCKYTVSPKNVVSCFFFAILLASTHPNCKSWGNFEKFRKFAYFSKFLCLPCSKFPEIFKTILTFAIWISKIAKKISFIFWGHPVHTILLIFNVNNT